MPSCHTVKSLVLPTNASSRIGSNLLPPKPPPLMESRNGMPGPSAPSETSAFHSFALPIPANHSQSSIDDSDEWEYEYSTTETETYYLTLDLTTPFTVSRRLKVTNRGRGSFRSKWINPGLGRQKRQLGRKSKTTLSDRNAISSMTPASFATPDMEEEEDNEEDQDHDQERDEVEDEEQEQEPNEEDAEQQRERGDDVDMDARDDESDDEFSFPTDLINKLTKPSSKFQTTKETEVKGEEIQILELHSDNPIIVYRNHVFSCSWAENIGTELLFSRRDARNSLETLRQLPDGVDLLAASSVRLLGKLATLEPRVVEPAVALERVREEKGKGRAGREVNRGKGHRSRKVADTRSQQEDFLERLAKVKEKRGEKDEVTVLAKQRVTNTAWKTLLKQRRSEEMVRLRRIGKMSGLAAEEARRKVAEMEREDGDWDGPEKGTQKGKMKPGRKKTVGQGVARKKEGASKVQGAVGEKVQRMEAQGSSLSTPTPVRWEDLEGEEVDEEDEISLINVDGLRGDEDGSEMDVHSSRG